MGDLLPWVLIIGCGYLVLAMLIAVVLLEIHKKGLLFSIFIGIAWGPALILNIYYTIKDAIKDWRDKNGNNAHKEG